MPIFGRKHKNLSTSPEIITQSRSLMYAQSTYSPSIAESTTTTTTAYAPSFATSQLSDASTAVAADHPSSRPQSTELVAHEPSAETAADGEADGASQQPEWRRPCTPPQGSRYLPWESYSGLAPDHPVFRYPNELREKLYAKGVDPVVKAGADLHMRGKVYGDRPHPVKGFKGRTKMAFGTMGGVMSVGVAGPC